MSDVREFSIVVNENLGIIVVGAVQPYAELMKSYIVTDHSEGGGSSWGKCVDGFLMTDVTR